MANNKKNIYVLFIFIVTLINMGCNIFFTNKPLRVLKEHTSLSFLQQNVDVIKFEEKKAGMAEETSLLAVYKLKEKINIYSLKRDGKISGFKMLPISNMDLGNGFDGNLLPSDSGYYRECKINCVKS